MYKVPETKKGRLGKRQIIVVEKNKLPTKQKVKSKFVLVKSTQMLHDKDCHYVSRVKYYEEVNSIDEQQEIRFCKKCYRKAVLRNGVTDFSNYDVYNDFFEKNGVDERILFDLFVRNHARATVLSNAIRIQCKEDTWKLNLSSYSGNIILEHNNYVRSMFGNRYMDKGFHRQKIKAKTVSGALKYVMTYDYEKGHPKDEQFLEIFEKTMEDVITRQLNKELEEEAI